MSYIDSTGSPCSFGPINGSCPEVPKMPGAFLETSKAKAGKVGKFSSNFRNGGAETRKFLGSSFRRCWMDGKGCWKTPFYKGSNSTLWKMLVCTWICFFVGDYCGLHLGIHHHFAPPCGIIFLGSLFASTSNGRNHKSKVMKLPGESTWATQKTLLLTFHWMLVV